MCEGGENMTSKKEEKNIKIEEEKKRLNKIFKKMDKNIFKANEKLIENLAWMSVTLAEMRDEINGSELVTTTKNASQEFIKEHPLIKSYNTTYANYLKGIKQLTDYLSNVSSNKIQKDELEKFLERDG